MQRALSKIDRYRIAIALTILAGVWLRLGHLAFIDPNAPFRLGGLFLEFSNQIIKDHFSLPVNIPFYSENGLPFAYPPLAFYVQALFINLFHPSKFFTVNVIPPVVAALSVPSFYYLAKQLTSSRLEAWSMLAAYVFIPNAFLDQIEAAGLPEAFGELALVWYAAFLIKVYKQPGWPGTIMAGLLLGINILSSPGSAVAAPLLSLLFAFLILLRAIKDRRLHLLALPVAIGLIGLIVSAPYWATVISQHGRGIFLGALFNQFQTGQRLSFFQQSLDRLLTFNFSSIRNNSFLWSALTFLGLITLLTGPEFYLPLLFILFSLLPREGIWLSAIVSAVLAGKGLVLVIQGVRANLVNSPAPRRRWVEYGLMSIFLVVASYTAFYAIRAIVNDRQWALEAQEAADLEKYAGTIPEDAKVIVVGNDAFLEWAPQLLQREVINTPYGLEWEPHELNRVNKFVKDLESAGTFDELMAAIKERFHLQDVYLVTNNRARFSNPPGSSGPGVGTVDVLVDEENLQIYHLVIE
jgi:hypothetical protein